MKYNIIKNNKGFFEVFDPLNKWEGTFADEEFAQIWARGRNEVFVNLEKCKEWRLEGDKKY